MIRSPTFSEDIDFENIFQIFKNLKKNLENFFYISKYVWILEVTYGSFEKSRRVLYFSLLIDDRH
jgi:hypothetical protein